MQITQTDTRLGHNMLGLMITKTLHRFDLSPHFAAYMHTKMPESVSRVHTFQARVKAHSLLGAANHDKICNMKYGTYA